MSRHARAVLLMMAAGGIGLVLSARHLAAQVVELQAGGDTYQHGIGTVARFWGPSYDGWLGIGHQDGPRVGAFVQFRFRRDTLRLGNDAIALRYPTDVFGLNYSSLVQGATWITTTGAIRTAVFAGASATGLGVPLFAAQREERPVGGFSVVDSLSPAWRAFGRVIVSRRNSAFAGLEWRDSTRTSLAASTGVGAARPFGALSATRVRDHYEIRASWTVAADGYRRVDLPSPPQPRLEGPAVELIVRPREWLALTATRQTFETDSGRYAEFSRATGSSFVASAQGERSHASVALSEAADASGRNASAYLALGRRFNERLAVDAYALAFRPRGSSARVTPVLVLHERASPSLVFDQMLTFSGDQRSVALGGTYAGALADIGVGYQLVHAPLSPDGPFLRTLILTLRFNLGDFALDVGTQLHPDGRVRYTFTAGRYLYFRGIADMRPARATVRVAKFVVRGRVADEAGRPIAGAALAIDDELVFTDTDGRFFVRRRGQRPVTVQVRLAEFFAPGRFEVVSAPTLVVPTLVGTGTSAEVVLRRLP